VNIPAQEVGSRLAIYTEIFSPSISKSEFRFSILDYPLQNFVAAFDYPRWPYGYGTGTASLGVQIRRSHYARSADDVGCGERLRPAGDRA